jgi:phosphatidylserine/phosphatidylglycerophosphate/cardiolipin synthase-like enzyme
MRKPFNNHHGLTGNAIAGTHVAFFGLDLAPNRRAGFRGFAFRRTDHTEEETVWLRGTKTFEKTEPHPAKGESFSTRKHPIQSFQWADYSVKPGHRYTYKIIALYGDPAHLQPKHEVTVRIETENETGPAHSAFFNRGSVATQEYARRFLNQRPSKAGPGAYEWLSRGLLEALTAFLDRAGPGWEVRGAIYEFQWPAALAAVKRAKKRGAKVKILFDDIVGSDKKGNPVGPWKRNREAIQAAGIKSLCKGLANGRLMHNKFFLLLRNGQPQAVWTGSTNLTENGIFGHSNVGHIVEDAETARSYLEYWNRLNKDPTVGDAYRSANMASTPAPPDPWDAVTSPVFSPRGTKLDSLEWYVAIAGGAERGLFMTFPFGMHAKFKDIYRRKDSILRMALLDKAYGSPKTKERDEKDLLLIRIRPNVVLAIGNRLITDSFDRWLAELDRITPGVHVYWVHTKYMLVDPLGAEPTVVTGSANFSEASTKTNDENMLVIRGDKRIADIYFGEFLRLYSHYAYREAVKIYLDKKKKGTPEDWTPQYLKETDAWMRDYFNPADRSGRLVRREYFAGPMAK